MNIDIFGTTCHIAITGPTDGQPLMLVHGAANDRDAWYDIVRPLADAGIRVIVPELPGHGLSSGKPLTSIEDIADWLLAVADALNLPQFALAGHSMGSLAALEATYRASERISRLVLLGSSVPMPVSAQLLETARTRPDQACRMVADWSHTPGFSLAGNGGHGVWGPGKTLAVMRRNAATLAADLDNCNRYASGLTAAAGVGCPTLLITGKRDRMTPARAVQPLQDALPHVHRFEVADCGHAMMVEKPREIAAAMIDFLRQE
jgi:pimeloyl-ACP methyl ester carboxylesterase